VSITIIAISPRNECGYAKIGLEIWRISPHIKGGVHSSSESELKEDIVKKGFKKCNMEFELLFHAWNWMKNNAKC
jgi:hypothetical protein